MLSDFKLFRAFKCCTPRQFKRTIIQENVIIRKPSPLRSTFLLFWLSFVLLLLLSVSVLINLRDELLIHGLGKTATLSKQNELSFFQAIPKISNDGFLNLSKSHYEYFKRIGCDASSNENKPSTSSSFLLKNRNYYGGAHHFQNISITKFNGLGTESSMINTGLVALEVFWSRTEERFRVCRFHNACINREGVIFLPEKLQQVSHLFGGCVSKEVVYVRNNSLPLYQRSFSSKQLYGLTEARKHIPLFLTDVIPSIYANELLRNEHISNNELSYRCFTENGSLCTWNRKIFENASSSNSLLVEDRVLKLSQDHWVPQFTNMLLDNVELVSLDAMFQYENLVQRHTIATYGRKLKRHSIKAMDFINR